VVNEACRAAAISKQAANQYKARHPTFAVQWNEAVETAVGRAEVALYERGVEGWDRPIFYSGKVVGKERVYSDKCLLRLLEARCPEVYGRGARSEHASPPGEAVAVRTEADALAELETYRAASRLLLESILSDPPEADVPTLPGPTTVSPGTGAEDPAASSQQPGGVELGGETRPDAPESHTAPASEASETAPGRPCPRCAGPGQNPYCPVCHGAGRIGG
jgi:hypothetical protein